MKRISLPLKTHTQKYAFAGAFFGLLFPIHATVIRILDEGLPLNLFSIFTVQSTDPLLWIIDTAPVFLCLFAIIAGLRQDSLEKTNNLLKSRKQDLESAQHALQARIDERAQELVVMSQSVDERTGQLKSILEISGTLFSVQELDDLLEAAAKMIGQQFDYYHVCIYLLDEQKQHAVLEASNSVSGRQMIQRGLRLKIGEPSMVEHAIRSGQTYFASNVSMDPYFKPDLVLPGTQSEIVLPLKAGQAILGAIELQSDVTKDFNEDNISALSVLAGLVGIAIQNAILNEITKRTLSEVEASSRNLSARAWSGWVESIRSRGYRYDGIRAEPLKSVESRDPAPTQNSMSIPLRLRGRQIGNLKIKTSDAASMLSEDDRAIAEAAAERAAFALEGARLLDEAQKRAAREAFLSDLASRLSTSFQLDSILRDTVEELGQTLKGSSVSFQLINPAMLSGRRTMDPDEEYMKSKRHNEED
jgi:GAF domain-containing protein